jgi:Hydrogenase maturation factor
MAKRKSNGLMKEGQDLVVAGYAGLAGTGILVREKRNELERYFSAAYLEQVLSECGTSADGKIWKNWISSEAAECEPAGKGGILTALWNLPEAYRLGITFSLRQIPVRQGTIEICEAFGLNPYRLYSDGCWLLAADHGDRAVEALSKRGISAAVIGRVVSGIAKVVEGKEEQGYLNRPQPDEIEKVIPDWESRI